MIGRRRVTPRTVAFALVFPALAVATVSAAAQQTPFENGTETGRIAGRIVDAETGLGMTGVSIILVEHRITVIAGIDGRYTIPNAPAGTVSVRAENIGYAAKTVTEVVVPSGGAVEVDIALEPSAIELEAITVTAGAERGSVARAIDQQRQASNIVSAIASEQISRSPDGDAGAAVRRVSGVTVQDGRYVFVRGLGERYTTTSLNGSRLPSPEPERKMVPFDLFPSGLLQGITTSKTFSPDQPGDFTGGQVNISTREFPATRQRSLSVTTGYNPDVVGKALPMAPTAGGEWLALSTSERQIPQVIDQAVAPRRGPEANEFVNALRPIWSAQNRTGRPSLSVGGSLGGNDEVFGRSIGYVISGTYSSTDEVNFDMRRANAGAGGSEFDRFDGTLGRYSVLWGGLANLSTLIGTHSRIALNNTYNRTADNEARFETGLYENHGTNVQIERLRYIERAVRSNQLLGEHQIRSSHRVDWSVTSSAVSRHEPDRSEFITWLDPAVPTWYNREGSFRAFGQIEENSLEASANYQIDFGSGGSRQLIRIGGLLRATDRDAFDKGYSIAVFGWTQTDPRWQLPPEEIFDGRNANGSDSLFQITPYNAGGSYRVEDRLIAGYAMGELALTSWLKLIAGARVERSEVTLDYEGILAGNGRAEPTYTDVLPSVSLNIDLTSEQKLRASASRTLARPEYREIAPINYREGLGEDQRTGNPELRRTLVQNYDLRWEWYPAPAEALSIGLFVKRFKDPIEQRYLARSGTNTLSFENAESASNYGVELEVMRNLGFLSAQLIPLSVFTNVTLMDSNVKTGREGDPDRAMVGQAPYVVNAGVTYAPRTQGVSVTLLYNVVGKRIINARPSGREVEDVVEQPRPTLDFSVRVPLLAAASAKLDLKNLLDSPYDVKQGDVVRRYYRSGRSASFGLSWSW